MWQGGNASQGILWFNLSIVRRRTLRGNLQARQERSPGVAAKVLPLHLKHWKLPAFCLLDPGRHGLHCDLELGSYPLMHTASAREGGAGQAQRTLR